MIDSAAGFTSLAKVGWHGIRVGWHGIRNDPGKRPSRAATGSSLPLAGTNDS